MGRRRKAQVDAYSSDRGTANDEELRDTLGCGLMGPAGAGPLVTDRSCRDGLRVGRVTWAFHHPATQEAGSDVAVTLAAPPSGEVAT